MLVNRYGICITIIAETTISHNHRIESDRCFALHENWTRDLLQRTRVFFFEHVRDAFPVWSHLQQITCCPGTSFFDVSCGIPSKWRNNSCWGSSESCGAAMWFEEMIASIEMAQLTKGTVDALKTGVARGPGGCSVPNRILDCRFQRYLGHGWIINVSYVR